MKIQQLLYVTEAYKCGSISKAARNLFMAQPNLSASIRELESEMGFQIFHRTSNGIECTEMGYVFLNYATDIIKRFEQIESLRKNNEKPQKMLSVITARSSEVCVSMAEFINMMYAHGESFRVKLREETNFDVINEVVTGAADLGILRVNTQDADFFKKLSQSNDLKTMDLPATPYLVLFSENHPLVKEQKLTREMLLPYIEVIHGDYEMPMYPPSHYKYHTFGQNDKKNVIFVYDRGSLMDILANVQGSYVWTSTTNKNTMKANGLVERKCDASPVEGFDIVVVNRKRYLTSEAQKFIDFLLKKRNMQN